MLIKTQITAVILTLGLLGSIPGFLSTIDAQEIDWYPDLEVARQVAARENRPLLIHFWGPNCRPCMKIERFVFTNPQVQRAFADNVVAVKFSDASHPQHFAEFGIQRMPQDVILSPSGQLMLKRPSPSGSDGYLSMLGNLDQYKPAPQGTAGTNTPTKEQNGLLAQLTGRNRKPLGSDKGLLSGVFKKPFGKFSGNKRNSGTAGSAAGAGALDPTVENHPTANSAPASYQEQIRQLANRDLDVRREVLANRERSLEANHQRASFHNSTARQPVPIEHHVPEPSVATIESPTYEVPTPDSALPAYRFSDLTGVESQVGPSSRSTPQTSSSSEQSSSPGRPKQSPEQRVISNQYADKSVSVDGQPLQPLILAASAAKKRTGSARRITNPNVSQETANPGPSSSTPDMLAATEVNSEHLPTQRIATEAEAKAAMGGYCPVSLAKQQKWVRGDRRFGCFHRGQLFLFASLELRNQFLRDPNSYCPILVGHDPVQFFESGQLRAGSIQSGVVVERNGRKSMVLFQSTETLKVFQADPEKYLMKIENLSRTANANSHADAIPGILR